ncbi:hypothetical protein LOK49_LG11G01244 [Camellia lanceoleosa]|uniref:Uncharacterized protein n=1 Tax=Camellia lanceoleosa TaxID=1840588 RepID=A0ACC0FXM0_9ERIC|nr:hypothetical protein LOK49_LG11G01244 [Camellia lanceoleosa]
MAFSRINISVPFGSCGWARNLSFFEGLKSEYSWHQDSLHTWPQSIFRYLPILSFTGSYIYQLDRLNEKMLKIPTEEVTVLERGFHLFIELFKTNPFGPLVLLLEHHGLLTERIREEFRHGEEYWTLERKLCCALTSNKKILVEDITIFMSTIFGPSLLMFLLFDMLRVEGLLCQKQEKPHPSLSFFRPHIATLSNQNTQQALALPKKEVIQPHLPVRLPCYDFIPVTSPAFGIPSLRLR